MFHLALAACVALALTALAAAAPGPRRVPGGRSPHRTRGRDLLAGPADVEPLVRSIPYRGESGATSNVYEVLPERKYERTVVDGWGNCSNLVFGLAYGLLRDGQDFEIVHFLPRRTYLDGDGHTVVRTRFLLEQRPVSGLVDVVGRAVPLRGEQPLDVDDLGHAIEPLSFRPIGNHHPRWERFYTPEFQADALVGRIRARDIDRYFRFLEATYVDLGLPARLEKMLYDGAAIVLGVYPRIHVASLDEARAGQALRFRVLEASLWSLRLTPPALLLLLGAALYRRLKRESARSPGSSGAASCS